MTKKTTIRPRKALRSRLRMAQIELLAAMQRSPTLSAAARDLNLTQPAASRLVNALAADLGMALFERKGRTLQPTMAGQVLMRKAAGFVAEFDRTQGELEATDEGLVGAVSVGAGIASSYVLLPRAITLLVKAAPRIAVTVREGSMEDLVARVRDGRIDLLVGRFETESPFPDLVIEKLNNQSIKFVCGAQHALARRRNVTRRDLLQESWILPESGTPMRAAVETFFRKSGMRPRSSVVESSAIQTNVALLNSLDLIWVLSEDVAGYFAGLGALRVLDAPALAAPGPFVVGYPDHRRLSPSAQRLKECLFEAARVKVPRRRQDAVR